jgi:hypothetical protein
MADSTDIRCPPTLEAFLAAGCDLTATGVWLEELAEVVLLRIPLEPPGQRKQRAEWARCMAASLLSPPHAVEEWRQLLLAQWSAEVYENPALAEPLLAALPTEVVDETKREVEHHRRPHPLELRLPEEWWRCANCGATYDEGDQEALIVTAYGDDEITYCFQCIITAAEVAQQQGVGKGRQR